MKKYNCTVWVINQKSEIMFREVAQNGVFKLISPLFVSLMDESDFSLKSFFSFVLHLFTESSLWGWMQGSKYIFFHFLFQNIHVYYQVPVISNNTECYQTFLISSFFSATESPFQSFQGIMWSFSQNFVAFLSVLV